LGGDEFAIVCEDESATTEVLLDRARDALAAPYTLPGGDLIAITVSIGTASHREGENTSEMLERADHAMYQAKATRRLV
jgi:diguanylate cyclase